MTKLLLKLAASATCLVLMSAPVTAQESTSQSAVSPAQIDPPRLAAAKITVDHVFPAGTYAKLMSSMTGQMMDQIMDSVAGIPLADLAKSFGGKEDELAQLGKGTLADIMAIYDPAYKQRTGATMDAMIPVLVGLMSKMEPGMRDGLTQAYAKRFTVEQLNDMNRFFATPSGTAYASNAMLIQQDPDVVAKMVESMPNIMRGLMEQLPEIDKKVKAATANLPKPREFKDLSASDRGRLAQLLGVPVKDLEANAAKSKAKK